MSAVIIFLTVAHQRSPRGLEYKKRRWRDDDARDLEHRSGSSVDHESLHFQLTIDIRVTLGNKHKIRREVQYGSKIIV